MLNFTHRHGRVYGIFNGRFVFNAAQDASALPLSTVHDLTTGNASSLLEATLRHEYLHWLVFKQSRLGNSIVGERFFARRAFVRHDYEPVLDYYARRTCFFLASYEAHEKVVAELEERIDKQEGSTEKLFAVTLEPEQIASVLDADKKAQSYCSALGLNRKSTLSVLDQLAGVVATREYGLQYYVHNDNSAPVLRETSMLSATKGVINGAFQDRHEDTFFVRLLKRIRRSANTEGGHIQLDRPKLVEWLCLKVMSEYRTLHNLASMLTPSRSDLEMDTMFLNDCELQIEFAYRHTLCMPRAIRVSALAARLLVIGKKTDFASVTKDDVLALSVLPDSLLYYFYCHGN